MATADLLVLRVEQKIAKNSKPYLDMSVRKPMAEGGEEFPAKVWDDAIKRSKSQIPAVKQVISAFFQQEEWNGAPQLSIEKYQIRENPDLELFRPKPAVDQEAVYKKLFKHPAWRNEGIKGFFTNLVDMLENTQGGRLKKLLLEVPAGAKNHHSRRAGLLQHLEEMWDLAIRLCTYTGINDDQIGIPHFPGLVDLEILLAGIVMHDLGKINDYDPDTLAYLDTREGSLLNHTPWGALTIATLWPTGICQDTKLKVTHCVLAHHGSFSAGAPVVPKIPEATLLCSVDVMSAHLDCHRVAIETSKDGKKTDYNKMMGANLVTDSYPPPYPGE